MIKLLRGIKLLGRSEETSYARANELLRFERIRRCECRNGAAQNPRKPSEFPESGT